MASTTRKPASGKSASKTPQGKATQAKAGAGPAIAQRSKDAKPTFGKGAPKKVSPAAIHSAARTSAKSDAGETGSPDGSLGAKIARGAKAAVTIAAGAVVVAAKGAASLASSVKGSKDRSKSKAK